MQEAAALKQREGLFALLQESWAEMLKVSNLRVGDQRSGRTWKQLVLGVLLKRSTRLVTIAQALLPWRKSHTVDALGVSIGRFLARTPFPGRAIGRAWLAEGGRRLAPQMERYRGLVLLPVDGTEYAKRSRVKRARHMQYVGWVRDPRGKQRSVPGYVDIWAGVVLRGQQFLPLARHLFSGAHPHLASQNGVEEAVTEEALRVLHGYGLEAIVLADRGFGRKEWIIALAQRHQAFVIRLDTDIQVWRMGEDTPLILAQALETASWLGHGRWKRRDEGTLTGQFRALSARIRFSRSGRKHDYQEAKVHFLQFVPDDPHMDPLTLVTTFPIHSLSRAQRIMELYAQRWAIETAIETMSAWGLDRFMVHSWRAIDRLLWIVALAYMLMRLALHGGRYLRAFRKQCWSIIKQLAALGRGYTLGKLAEAIGLDYIYHPHAWFSLRL